jgi:hypothetical protein
VRRVRFESLFKFIRLNQATVSELLFFAAGLAGACFQALHPGDAGAEMMSVAKNVATEGKFANPFPVLATGNTAVVPPLYPIVVAGLIEVLRVPILVYGVAVLGTILANAATAMLLPRISVVFYGDIIPGVIASVLWITTMQSMPGSDSNYTILGLLLFCAVASSSTIENKDGSKRAVVAGVIGGLLFLLNPSSVLITLPWIVFVFWRRKEDLHSRVKHCLVILAILSVFVIGWCGRNSYELGAFVVRTNLGMTLYASNNDCAESSMFRNELSGCYQTHHPNTSIQEAELLRKVGEVYYDRKRIADAKRWIQANPSRFLNLTRTRVLEFWFPAAEAVPTGPGQFANNYVIPDYVRSWVRRQNGVAYAIWLVTALSIPGLILMARRREAVTVFILAVMAIYPPMYYIVVSDMRYRYPILFLSLLSAGYFISEALVGRNSLPQAASSEMSIDGK